MSAQECLIKKGFSKQEVADLVGEVPLSEAEYVQALRRALQEADKNIRDARLQAVAIDRAVGVVNNHPNGPAQGLLSLLAFDKTGKAGISSIDILANNYFNFAAREMSEMLETLMPKVSTGWKVDDALRAKIVREIHGEATGDDVAARLAKQFSDTAEKMRVIHNKLGGDIKKDQGWNLPQSHNAYRIRKVSQSEWVDFTISRLDMGSMWNKETKAFFKSEEELRPYLNDMYENIRTNGAAKMDWEKSMYKDMMVATGLTQKGRFLRFKNGDSWLEYQKNFGEEDIFSSMMTYMKGIARENAMLKTLGPNPGAAMNYLAALARTAGGKDRLITRAENIWKDLSGQMSGKQGMLQRFVEGTREVMTFKLGSAPISAIGDQGTLALVSRANGIPFLRTHMLFLKTLKDGKLKQFLLQSGVNSDYVIDVTSGMTRYSEASSMKVLGKMSDRFHRLSGLNAMTEAGKASIQLSTLGHLANVEKKSWAELSPENIRMMTEFGIDEADWKVMSKSKKQTIDGARFVDLRNLPNNLQLKVANMMDVLAYRAIPAPDAEVMAIMKQGTVSGTAVGEGLRSMMQFKSFGISVLLYHTAYAANLGGAGSTLKYLASMIAFTTVMGASAVQIKQLVAGKEMYDTESPKFWLSAMMQGGGFGIYGDFLFRDYTRYGTSFYGTLAGPSLSSVEGLVRGVILASTQEALKESIEGNPQAVAVLFKSLGTGTIEQLRNNLPTQLWYTKLVMDRFIFETTNQMIDDKYINKLHTRQARLEREEDRGLWWQPLEVN